MLDATRLLYPAAALAFALSLLVWTQARTRQGRRLGLLLFAEAATSLLTAMLSSDDGRMHQASIAAFAAVVPMSTMAYLWFLGTVRSPWSAICRGRAMIVWGAACSLWFVVALTSPELFAPDRPGRATMQLAGMALFLFGLVLAIDQYRRATPSTRRADGWFLAGFGVRDSAWAIALPIFAFTPHTSRIDDAAIVYLAVSLMVFHLLIAYAILRANLFDIDLKIKFGLSRTTVAAIIAVAALVGSEAIERLLGVDQLLPAVLIGAAMSLVTRPLIRLGDRLADSAMPGVRDTPDYRARRTQEVYQAAWEQAIHDGIVTDAERDSLAALADSLGLSAGQARAIENAVGN